MNPSNGGSVLLAHISTHDQTKYFLDQWTEHYFRQQAGDLTDLLLLAGGLLVPVHQAVVLPLSPLLSQLVSPPCCWQMLPTVSLPGIDPVSVQSLVQLVYTGRCNVSTGLKYSKLIELLESLGIDIQQTLVSLDENQPDFVSDQPLNLSLKNGKTENNFDLNSVFGKNDNYCHKKFRAAGSATPVDANHLEDRNEPLEQEMNIESYSTTPNNFNDTEETNEQLEKGIKLENGPVNQSNNNCLSDANQEMYFSPLAERTNEGIFYFPQNDLMEWAQEGGSEQNVLVHSEISANFLTPDHANQEKKEKKIENVESHLLERSYEEFVCACETCGMKFLSDKLVSYVLHQKECHKLTTPSPEVNFNNEEAKTSMMSKQLQCPYCDEKSCSIVHHDAHVNMCKDIFKNSTNLWDVNNCKQLEIANDISFEEEELDDSQNANDTLLDDHGTPLDILMKRKRSSSKFACQICSDVFLPPYHLKMHYTERHFYKELSESVPMGNLICRMCDKKFSCRKALIMHIGATHEIALDLLAKKLQKDVNDYNNPTRNHVDKDDSLDELIIDLNNDSPLGPLPFEVPHQVVNVHKERIDKYLRCDLCEANFNTNYLLQAHFSTKHYRVQLEAEFGGIYESKQGACPMCGKATKILTQFIQHVGAFHNEVSKYIGKACDETKIPRGCRCPFAPCQLWCQQKSHLVRHLTTCHYLNEIDTLCKPFWTMDKVCPKCKKSFLDFNYFRIHLAVTHNMVEKFYTEDVKEYLASLPTNKRKSDKAQVNEDQNIEMCQKSSNDIQIEANVPIGSLLRFPQAKNPEAKLFVYSCYKCEKRFENLTYLLNHFTLIHYRQKLTAKFAKAMKTDICNICNLSVESTDRNKMLRHIGVTHRRVLSCLPKDVSDKLNEKTSERAMMCSSGSLEPKVKESVILAKKNIKIESPENKYLKESETVALLSSKSDELTSRKVSLKGEDRFCQLCDNRSRTISTLLLHLTMTHFRSKLKEKFLPFHGEKFPKECPICQREMLTTTSFISHIGATHRKVIEYTPWIKQSPEGDLWFSNNSGASSYSEGKPSIELPKNDGSTADQVSFICSDSHLPQTSGKKRTAEPLDFTRQKKSKKQIQISTQTSIAENAHEPHEPTRIDEYAQEPTSIAENTQEDGALEPKVQFISSEGYQNSDGPLLSLLPEIWENKLL